MKHPLLFVIAILAPLFGLAQEPQIGLVKVRLEYSRPSMHGRKIFGDLLPYDQLWRRGTNVNTTITIQDSFTLGGIALGAGSYTPQAAVLTIAWENTYIEIPLSIATDRIMESRIYQSKQILADDYASAAWIYYRDEKDVKKALLAIAQSILLREDGKSFESWLGSLDLSTNNFALAA